MIKSVLPLSIHLRNVFEISMTSRNNASYVTSVSKTRFATFCSFFFSSDSSLRSFKVKLYKNDSNLKNRQPLIVNQEKNTFLIVFFFFCRCLHCTFIFVAILFIYLFYILASWVSYSLLLKVVSYGCLYCQQF